MNKLLYKKESYKIIGACLEENSELGKGFNTLAISQSLTEISQSCTENYER